MLQEACTDRRRAQAGLDLTKRVLKLLEPTSARGLLLEASLVCALFEAALGETDRALDRVLDCLHEAEPQGYVRVFLDQGAAMDTLLTRVPASNPSYAYAQALLRASAASAPASAGDSSRGMQAMDEPLSDRELGVLRLLATSLSSSEIADQLYVATSTVRSHTKAIYGKLGVHTRLEAIDAARDLGLI
jgi:LuxR family maltose regulon positive regulatory protein